jgi:hypothetical protein
MQGICRSDLLAKPRLEFQFDGTGITCWMTSGDGMGVFIKIEQKRKRREGEKERRRVFREIVSCFGSFTYNITLLYRVAAETVLYAAARSSQPTTVAGELATMSPLHYFLFPAQTRRCDRSCESLAEWHSHSQLRGVDASSSLRLCVFLLPWLRPEGDQVKSRTRFVCRPAVFSFCLMIDRNYSR